MATITSHIEQWQHNRKLLSLIGAEFPDWIVTVSFYTALHAVDCLLTHDGVTGIHTHDARNPTLGRTNRYQEIYLHYKPLYDLSRKVRYLAEPQLWIPFSHIQKEILYGYLFPIEKSVLKLSGRILNLAPITLQQSSPLSPH